MTHICLDRHQAIIWTNAGIFSAANLTLAGFPRTNALGESMPSRLLNMFNLCLCNAAIIRYSQLKFGHMHLCGMDYKYFSPHCCKCNSFGCTAAIRCDNASHGPHSDSLYSGSEHCQFNSPRLVKHEAGFPNPRRALIGSNQLWRVNDSAYYRELLIRPLGTNFSEMLIQILAFWFMKMRLKVSSAKWWPFCLGLNELSMDLILSVYLWLLKPFWLLRPEYS